MARTKWLRTAFVFTGALLLLTAGLSTGRAVPSPALIWYKGNLHTHTTNSDGDSAPEVVASWYKNNGYQFLAITDHNRLTGVADLNAAFAEPERFLLLPGEELTDSWRDLPVHVNALNLAFTLAPPGGSSVADTLRNGVNLIRSANALPSVNHPNFGWALTSRDLMQVDGLRMLEVYNGHPDVNNMGGGGAESLEQMWDALLSSDRAVLGIAVDDAHHFRNYGRGWANPGRAWVCVRAASLTVDNVMQALQNGDFYASTGVELGNIQVAAAEIRLEIKEASSLHYTTTFSGQDGQILARVSGNTPSYRFDGGEKYVRARVDASNGDVAWTQPVYPSREQ